MSLYKTIYSLEAAHYRPDYRNANENGEGKIKKVDSMKLQEFASKFPKKMQRGGRKLPLNTQSWFSPPNKEHSFHMNISNLNTNVIMCNKH